MSMEGLIYLPTLMGALLIAAQLLQPWIGELAVGETLLAASLSSLAVILLVWIVRSVWHAWLVSRVIKREEPGSDEYLSLLGEPLFDPNRGVYGNIYVEGQIRRVLINPKWWSLLPPGEVSSRVGTEAAILNKVYSRVEPRNVPKNVVFIKSQEQTVGVGSRVSWGGDSNYLLTANHVIAGRLSWGLARDGMMVDGGENWPIEYRCHDLRIDFAMVKVPAAVWSSLKVGAAPLVPMEKRCNVTIYGGNTSSEVMSSAGLAGKGEYAHQIVHEAPSTQGWSGAPLMWNGKVVGTHTGINKLGETNRAVNVGVFLSLRSETVYSEVSYHEIDQSELEIREDRDSYYDVTIEGIGDFTLGKSDYAVRSAKVDAHIADTYTKGKMVWADVEDDDIDQELANWLERTAETLPLNGLGAAQVMVPPCKNSPVMSGLPASESRDQACGFPMWEDRLVNLEKLVERLLHQLSVQPSQHSRSLENMAGQSEAPKPSLGPSCSKPPGSVNLRPQTTLMKQSIISPKSTPVPVSAPASQGSGPSKASRRRRRASAKKQSTGKLPQVSPSPQLPKQTGK